MNKTLIALLLTLAMLKSNAESNSLDPGGVSVDFAKVKPPTSITYGPNLVKNSSFEIVNESGNPVKKGEWFRSWHVHAPAGKKAESIALKKAAEKLVITTTATDTPSHGKRHAKFITPKEVHEMRFNKKQGLPMISNGFGTSVPLPSTNKTGQYQLSFAARGKLISKIPGLNKLVVVVNFRGGSTKSWKCKPTGKSLVKHFSLLPKWQKYNIAITAPNGTNFINFYIKLYGCGEADIDDVELRQTQIEEAVSAKIIPTGYLDNNFYMTPNDAAILCISCKNNGNVETINPFIDLKLPKAVKLKGPTSPFQLESSTPVKEGGKDYIIYKVKLKNYKPRRDAYFTWGMPSFVLETKAKPGTDLNAYYKYIDKNFEGDWNHFMIKVVAGSAPAEKPKQFKTAAMFAREADIKAPEAFESFISFYNKTGLNSLHGRTSPELRQALKASNIKQYAQPYFLCNGYRLGEKKKPENVLFKLADGSYRTTPREAICPVEVYKEGPYFKSAIIPYIEEYLITKDICDSIMPNWELHAYDFKGCFCERCKNEFIKFSKLPKAELDVAWPKEIIVKYRTPWIKFRSWQHAKLVEVLEKNIHRIGKTAGKDAHFIPEIAWSALTEGGVDHYKQYDPKDYLDKLPILEPWGPYIFFDVTRPYIYNTGVHLITYEAGKTIKEYVKKHVKDKTKTPELIAFPHGLQCNTWVTEPEAVSFEMLCYLVNGWNGTFLYYLPRGYDSRWWNAIINANRDIAAYENFTLKGKEIHNFSVTPVTPVPKKNLPSFWTEGGNFMKKLPTLKDAQMIQARCYELNNKKLLAIGNFWQKGEVFVKASIPNLEPNSKYTVSQPAINRNLINTDKTPYFTGKDLADGILLHAGALRWAFYVIEPYCDMPIDQTLSQTTIKQELAKRLPAIKQAIEWEKNYIKELQAETAKANGIPDYSKMQDMQNGSLSCTVIKFEGNNAFELSVNNQKITISPANGAQIKAWKHGNDSYIGTGQDAMIAADGFWWPKDAVGCLFTPYTFISQKKTANGIQLVFQRKLSHKDSKALQGNQLEKKYDISKNGLIQVTTTITNTTGQPINFSYRRKSMIRYMEVVDNKRGQATMGDVIYERDFTQKLLRVSPSADKDIEKVFSMERVLISKSPDVNFSAPFLDGNMAYKTIDKANLHCFVFWDSGKQKYATFEPIFKKVSLGLRESWSITTQWQVK